MRGAEKNIFDPKRVGLVGLGEWKGEWRGCCAVFRRIVDHMAGFKKFYPVDLSGKIEGCGRKIGDLPKRCDLVGVALPEPLLEKNIKKILNRRPSGIVIFTPNVSQRTELELGRASKHLLIAGPGSAGFILPHKRLCLSPHSPPEAGNVALVSQVGELTAEILAYFVKEKIGVSGAMCFGIRPVPNTFVDLVAQDSRTHLVALHVRGGPSGRELYESVKAITRKKRVVVFSSGEPNPLFQTAVRQAGAIYARRLTTLVGGVKHLLGVTSEAPRTVVVSNSKFLLTLVSEQVKRLNLVQLSHLSQKLRKKVRELQLLGQGCVLLPSLEQKQWKSLLKVIAKDAGVDRVIALLGVQFYPREEWEPLVKELESSGVSTKICLLPSEDARAVTSQNIFADIDTFIEGLEIA